MGIIIAGGGKVGSYLAGLLLAEGYSVKVIEVRREEVARLQRELRPDSVILGNATDPIVLEAAGVHQAQALAAVTGSDETNLVITSLARFEFSVPRTVGRINNPKNGWLYTPAMGVDAALNQAELMARLTVEEMSVSDMTTLLTLRKGQFELVQETVASDAPACVHAVRDLRLPSESILLVVEREGKIFVPRGDTLLEPGDQVLALVHADQRQALATALGGAACLGA